MTIWRWEEFSRCDKSATTPVPVGTVTTREVDARIHAQVLSRYSSGFPVGQKKRRNWHTFAEDLGWERYRTDSPQSSSSSTNYQVSLLYRLRRYLTFIAFTKSVITTYVVGSVQFLPPLNFNLVCRKFCLKNAKFTWGKFIGKFIILNTHFLCNLYLSENCNLPLLLTHDAAVNYNNNNNNNKWTLI